MDSHLFGLPQGLANRRRCHDVYLVFVWRFVFSDPTEDVSFFILLVCKFESSNPKIAIDLERQVANNCNFNPGADDVRGILAILRGCPVGFVMIRMVVRRSWLCCVSGIFRRKWAAKEKRSSRIGAVTKLLRVVLRKALIRTPGCEIVNVNAFDGRRSRRGSAGTSSHPSAMDYIEIRLKNWLFTNLIAILCLYFNSIVKHGFWIVK
jgi:hypothetical protein